MEEKYIKTHQYITNRWGDALISEQNKDYSLPFPFVPPCVNGLFKVLFYWDTYYTNHGMLLDGKIEYANGEMMGWTAGIFQWIFDYIFNK